MKRINKMVLIILSLGIISIINSVVVFDSDFIVRAESTQIKLNKKKVYLTEGQRFTLKLKGNKRKVKWSTNNKTVASVTDKGKVIARKQGKAKITAKAGGKEYVAKVIVSDVPVAEFENGDIGVIESKEDIHTYAKKVKVKFEKGQIKASFVLKGEYSKVSVKITATPLEGVANISDSKEVIGSVQSITKGFEIMSLRLEEKASILTLMPFNLDLEGKAIVSIGVRKDDKVYYFQTEIRGINFSDLSKYADENKDDFSQDDIIDLEKKYLYMNSDLVTKSEELELAVGENGIESLEFASNTQKNIADENNPDQNRIQERDDSEITALMNYLNKIEENGEVSSDDLSLSQGVVVHPLVDDSIFKNGAVDEWRHVHGGYYCYSFISNFFAGTRNRETHIILLEVVKDIKKSPFRLSLHVLKNMYVYFVNRTGSIGSREENRIEVRNLNLILESLNKKGFFISSKFWGVQKESMMSKIAGLVGSNIKYVSKAITVLKTFKKKNLYTNLEVSFQSTAKKQKKVYGKLMNRINAKCKVLKYPGDFFTLEAKGKKLKNKVRAYYTYSYKYK